MSIADTLIDISDESLLNFAEKKALKLIAKEVDKLQKRIKELEADYADLKEVQSSDYAHAVRNADRIKELEAALRKIKAIEDDWYNAIPECDVCYELQKIAEQVLKGGK